jgi:hypothetical protein
MDLGTVVTVVELVNKAIAIYKRIESLPQQMVQMGRRMEDLDGFLSELRKFLEREAKNDKKDKKDKTQLLSGQLADLRRVLGRITTSAEQVYDVFDRYENGILSRSKDLTFRASWMKQLWFSVVDSSADKVQAIIDDIDQQRELLRDYLSLMAIIKAYEPRPGRSLERTTLAVPTRRGPPSPSPTPPRRDYKILFVDPYNEARSVIAEALLKLLGQMTLKARGDWRIAEIHSAGFFAKRRSEYVDVIDGLDYSDKTFKLPWKSGSKRTDAMALSAVFDNKWANYPFKEDLRSEIEERTSRGMMKNVFSRFDFVFVFTLRDHDNMIKLKEALRERDGADAVPRCKGRVLQLGTYLAQKRGQVREILHLHPLEKDDPKQDREDGAEGLSQAGNGVDATQ